MKIENKISSLYRLNIVFLLITSILFLTSIHHTAQHIIKYGWEYEIEQQIIIIDERGVHHFIDYINISAKNNFFTVVISFAFVIYCLENFDMLNILKNDTYILEESIDKIEGEVYEK